MRRLTKAREDKDKAERALTQLGNQLAGLNANLTTKKELRKTVDNSSAKAHTQVYDAQNPVCKTCGTRMDQKALDFVREREQEKDDLISKITEIAGDIDALEANIDGVKYQIAAAQQAVKPLAGGGHCPGEGLGRAIKAPVGRQRRHHHEYTLCRASERAGNQRSRD
jgi:chromosome segregation ATPase